MPVGRPNLAGSAVDGLRGAGQRLIEGLNRDFETAGTLA